MTNKKQGDAFIFGDKAWKLIKKSINRTNIAIDDTKPSAHPMSPRIAREIAQRTCLKLERSGDDIFNPELFKNLIKLNYIPKKEKKRSFFPRYEGTRTSMKERCENHLKMKKELSFLKRLYMDNQKVIMRPEHFKLLEIQDKSAAE